MTQRGVTQRRWLGRMLWLALLLAGVPMAALGQSASDYARIAAPDVAQASGFLTQVMGCDALDVSADRALLECSQGAIVEIVQGDSPATSRPALQLRIENVDAALGWLQRQHVAVIGDHAAGTRGDGGLVRIDVQAPWGQTLELIGHGTPDTAAPDARLAAD